MEGFRSVLGALGVGVLACHGCAGSEHQIFDPLPPRAAEVGAPAEPDPADAEQGGAPAPAQGGGSAPAADAGPVADEDLDESVTFVWVQTLPGQGTCKAGRYAGSFSCTRTDGVVISGQVSFTLEGSAEQQRLSVLQGAVRDLTGALFNSGMEGELDCLESEFNAVTVDGTGPIGLGTFEATLVGDFDDQALSIVGTIGIVDGNAQTCAGSFRVGATP